MRQKTVVDNLSIIGRHLLTTQRAVFRIISVIINVTGYLVLCVFVIHGEKLAT